MIGLGLGWYLAVIIELFLIGIFYNLLIEWASKKGFLEANQADAVVFWVALTLIGLALLDWEAAKLALIAFIATGLPMWFGYKWRYAQARRRELEEERKAYLEESNQLDLKGLIDQVLIDKEEKKS